MRLFNRPLGLAAAVVALSGVSGQGFAQELPIADLAVPRGLSVSEGTLLIAVQGAGRILAVPASGAAETVLEGIVVGEYESAEGPLAVGVNAVIKAGDSYFFTVGGSLGTIPGSEAVYVFTPGSDPKMLADLGTYEKDNNTGGDVDRDGKPEIDSNPYDLVTDGNGGVFVSEAAANAIFHVGSDGTLALHAQFPDRENPLAGTVGGPTIDEVPTGITVGPDGALYVATLTGFPFPQGAARVYRVADANGDGDALDEGDVTVFAEGLTAATDVAFDADGALLVTEFSTDFLAQAPGRLVRVVDGTITEVAGGLVSPTGVAVLADGRIVVSQEFAGLVGVVGAP